FRDFLDSSSFALVISLPIVQLTLLARRPASRADSTINRSARRPGASAACTTFGRPRDADNSAAVNSATVARSPARAFSLRRPAAGGAVGSSKEDTDAFLAQGIAHLLEAADGLPGTPGKAYQVEATLRQQSDRPIDQIGRHSDRLARGLGEQVLGHGLGQRGPL